MILQGKIHVLMIEDNPGDVRIAQVLLRDDPLVDYSFTTFDTLKASFVFLQDHKPDIILLDLNLPDSHGPETFITLQEKCPDMPIVVMSGNVDQDAATEAVRLGAQDYLNKGAVDGPALSRVIRYALERKQVISQLHQSEAQYRRIVETAMEGIFITDADDTFSFVNQKLADMLGYTKEEMLGANSLHFVLQKDRELLQEKTKNSRKGIKESYEIRILRKDGTPLHALINSTPRFDHAGEYSGALVMVTDITQRKQAEMLITRERDRAQKYFDFAGIMLLVLDSEGKILQINQKGLEILEYQHEKDLVGKDWFSTCLPKKIRAEVRNNYYEVLRENNGLNEYIEKNVITRTGQVRHIAWHNTTLRDPGSNKIIGTLSSGEDITERVIAARQRELLLALSRQAALETDFGELLFFIADQLLKIISAAQSASVFMVDYQRQVAQIKAWAGFGEDELTAFEVPLKDSVTQRVIQTRKAAHVADVAADPEFISIEDQRIATIQSSIVAPILAKDGSCFGLIFCDNRQKTHAFSDDDLTLLETICNQLSGVIENTRLLAQLKEQQQKTNKERDRAQNYLDIAEVMIVALDEKGIITLANRKSCDILGYQEEELLGKNWFSTSIPPGDYDQAWGSYVDFLSSDGITGPDYEQVFITSKGEERTARWQSRKLFDENGKTVGALSSGEDITESKQAEESLKQYERIVSSSSDMMALVNKDLVYLAANNAYCHAFDLNKDELIGMRGPDLFNKEFFTEIIRPNIERCFKGEEVVYYEWTDYPELGTRYTETHYYPYYGAGNTILGLVTNRSDITEQYRTHQALRASENRLSHIINNSTNLFYSHSVDHKITFISPQSESMLGYPPVEMLRKWTDLITDNPVNNEGVKLTEKAIETGQVQPPYELELRAKSGKRVWVEVHEAPILEDGKVTQIVGSLTDITSRRRAEMESQRSLAALKIANIDLRAARDRIQGTMEATIRTIAKTVEVRDPYTAGHHRRVSDLSVRIAEEMGLDDEIRKAIALAAVIHDLGKIQVPAEILSKPGKLTEIEFSLVKTHPTVGYDLLKTIEFPWPLAEIIYMHHERMDGSGYPQGLSADEIPIESRIIGVADTVEAMSSHRPYRPALGIERALGQIRSDRETLFDPLVVDACLRVFENGYQMTE